MTQPNQPTPQNPTPAAQIYVASDEAKIKAKKFFEHAKKSMETHNYDYAIKLYVDGLAVWPDAVEEGLKQLRVAATARRLDGGKGAGFLAARQWPTNTKDILKNLNGALYLFGMDPSALEPMEKILINASKARLIRTVAWIAPVLTDAYNSAKKLSESDFREACQAMDTAADFAMAMAEDKIALDILQAAISTSQIWATNHPNSTDAPRARSHATGKMTIVKGKFDRATGFQDSLQNAEAQHELRDRGKAVLSVDRHAELIAKARAAWEADRETAAKLFQLVEMLARDENEAREKEAIELLESEYVRTTNYAYKAKADDIRIRQMNRRKAVLEARLKTEPTNIEVQKAVAEIRVAQNNLATNVLLDRQKHYPTDLRIKFQLGVRYLNARRLDDAIPLLQLAQADGRVRAEARLYMGRCFFEKRFYPQAIDTFRGTLKEMDTSTGPVLLELNYWLGRALEETGAGEEAKKIYGHLIQLDYNYKDARQRLEALVGGQ